MKTQTKAYFYAISAVIFWSTVATAFKITLRHVNFLQMLTGASFIAVIVLFLIILGQKKLSLIAACTKKEYLSSALLGFLNPFLYYVILFKAYSLLTAQEAVTLNYTWPIMLVILSVPLLKQPITLRSALAVLISFIGVFIVATGGDITGFRFTNGFGVVLALSSAVVWALFWIYNVRDRRDEVVKLFMNFTFGFVFILPVMLLFSPAAFSKKAGLLGMTYIGLFEMGITFVLWLKALRLSQTTAQVSILIFASPFLSLVFIHFILGEEIMVSTMSGLAFIITGVMMQHFEHRYPKNTRLSINRK